MPNEEKPEPWDGFIFPVEFSRLPWRWECGHLVDAWGTPVGVHQGTAAFVTGHVVAAAPDLLRERDALRQQLRCMREERDAVLRDRDEARAELFKSQDREGVFSRALDEARQQRDALADVVALEVGNAEVYLAQGTPSAVAGPLERMRAALAKAGRP